VPAAGAALRLAAPQTSHPACPAAPRRLPQVDTVGQRLLLSAAVGYMLLIVIIPFFNVFVQAFSHGLDPFIETVQEPDFQQV
jgi:ABC-type sulfate transport system permease subunit